MLLAGEGRDRPAFLSESSGEVHGAPAPVLLPRDGHFTVSAGMGPAPSSHQQEVLSRGWTESRDVSVCSYSFNKSVSNIPVEDE